MSPASHHRADADWHRSAAIYQVYIRSFRDGDGDGIGDIAGIRERLPWLAELGIDALWINPWYPSPQHDAGYDVSDYRDIDPRFGTIDEARELIDDAHRLGLRVILDIVPNHTSSEHPWFQAALTAGPGSPERARYLFRAGRGTDGELPPNDWLSVFGGAAWTRVADGEWYLHLFDSTQPDLDWTNDDVRAEFESILRFWFDAGVDGFRIDVAHGLAKDPEMPDLGLGPEQLLAPTAHGNHPHWDRDEVHEVWQAWRRIADAYDPPRVYVAEAWTEDDERLSHYLRPDELHTAFNFHFLRAPWNAAALRDVVDASRAAVARVGAASTWVLSNHDVVRHVSRYARERQDRSLHSLGDLRGTAADLELGTLRSRAAALLMLALPGSCYLYQGEELGLPEVEDLPDAVKQDPAFRRTKGVDPGRDGCRVPIPWSGERPPFGFGPEGSEPWLPQPAGWRTLTAEAQAADDSSMLALYRAALRIRREHPALGDGDMRWFDELDPAVTLAFTREPGFACVVNFGDSPIELPTGDVLLASAELVDGLLPKDAAAWLRTG